ncbi:MAG: hypothetical protein H6672_08655 [Anaerolineaceae bacterium]|nr:hypothetical protein [Anaerolineaceae bacterium]
MGDKTAVLSEGNAWIRPVPEDWQYDVLSDLLIHVVDNRGKTPPTVDSGIPLIATYNISNSHLYPTEDNLRYVSKVTYDNWFRSHPQSDDIIPTKVNTEEQSV